MNPPQAMGTFLRVWRAEWAGLSRAQLAIAVDATSQKPKKVTPKVIRRWEEGQPPKTTDEFEALLAVMDRHGLSERETDQFRQAVFAACLDRQYPEIFGSEGFAHRRDVHEVAYAAYRQSMSAPTSHNIVHLIACVDDLERTVRGGSRHSSGPGQARSQQVALVYAWGGLRKYHSWSGRAALAAATASASAGFMEAHFGPQGLDGAGLSVLGQRPCQALALAKAHPSLEAARRLFRLSEEARAAGNPALAVKAFLNARPCYLYGDLPQQLVRALPSQLEDCLRTAQRLEDPGLAHDVHFHLAHCYMTQGLLGDEVDRQIEVLSDWETGRVYERCLWYATVACLAHRRGQLGEAAAYCERGLAIARPHGLQELEGNILGKLDECERAQSSARRRNTRPSKPSKQSARGSDRSPKRRRK